ncbi:MAG TPA: GNAT family N-acetyltransferase [Ktedonobacteraceae bacterium]
MIIRQMRVEDAAGLAHVHVKTWRTTYRGIVPDAYLDAISVEEWRERWLAILRTPEPGRFGYVAEDEARGEIAGFVRGGITRYPDLPYQGELYAIYILPEYQQQGLGRRLVGALVSDLLASGLSNMLLWVFEKNHSSRRFYASLGGKQFKTNSFEIAGVSLLECAYVWDDLTPLLWEGQV